MSNGTNVILLDESVRVVRISELLGLLDDHSQQEVAAELGVSQSTLSRFLKKHAVIQRRWVAS